MINLSQQEIVLLNEPARSWKVRETLEATKAWLAVADLDDPQPVVELRAGAVEIATAYRSIGLNSEALLDAKEIARRCERFIAAAIRRGQQQGRIRRGGARAGRRRQVSPESVAGQRLSGSLSAYYALWENLSVKQFEAIITAGRSDGSLSQQSLLKLIHQSRGYIPPILTRSQKKIAELAASNHTSRQIASLVMMRVDVVTGIARDAGIDIPADRVAGKKSRRISSVQAVNETISTLEGLAMGCDLLDPSDLITVDPTTLGAWSQSLTESLKTLSTLKKELARVENSCQRNGNSARTAAVGDSEGVDAAAQRDHLGGAERYASLTPGAA